MRNARIWLASAAILAAGAFATPAMAGNPNNHGGCQHNCGGGPSVDVHDNAVAVAVGQGGAGGSANNSNTNNANNSSSATGGAGGAGGMGGAGGNATGGSATGGSATGGSASAANNGNNNGNNNSSSSNTQNQNQDQNQSQSQSANNQSDNSSSNNSSQEVNVNNNSQRNPVSTAYAAPLFAGEDTCMGSSSIGAQAVTFGLSLGTTWRDANCQRLKNSRQLVALGYHRAATSLMCQDANVRAAMEEAGTPCPNGPEPIAAAPPIVVAPPPSALGPPPVALPPPAPPPPPRRRVRQRDGES